MKNLLKKIIASSSICLLLVACNTSDDTEGDKNNNPLNNEQPAEQQNRSPGGGTANPVAPSNVSISTGNRQLTLAWDDVEGATQYNVYIATETGVTPGNYSVIKDGQLFSDVSSPLTIKDLNSNKSYFVVVTTMVDDLESEAGDEFIAVPNVDGKTIDNFDDLSDADKQRIIDLSTSEYDIYQNENLELKAPDIAENGAVVPVTFTSDIDLGTGMIWFVIPNNPESIVAGFKMTPESVPYIATRVKMRQSDDVVVVYMADSGAIYTTKKYVAVTISGIQI